MSQQHTVRTWFCLLVHCNLQVNLDLLGYESLVLLKVVTSFLEGLFYIFRAYHSLLSNLYWWKLTIGLINRYMSANLTRSPRSNPGQVFGSVVFVPVSHSKKIKTACVFAPLSCSAYLPSYRIDLRRSRIQDTLSGILTLLCSITFL